MLECVVVVQIEVAQIEVAQIARIAVAQIAVAQIEVAQIAQKMTTPKGGLRGLEKTRVALPRVRGANICGK